jgi:hypothetical protein
MRVLLACEESQAVTKEMRKLGVEAFSCDLLPCSGGHPEWHIQGDVSEVLKQRWDMIIAFPPCTYLTISANAWYNVEKFGDAAIQRLKDREEAIKFFMMFANADCEYIAIENPVGVMSTIWRKPDQIIQPYMFGDDASKKTCLWLKGLPPLKETSYVQPRIVDGKPRWSNQTDSGQKKLTPSPDRSKLRSKTYAGIAKVMA